jgi:Tol biopolymer transport system component
LAAGNSIVFTAQGDDTWELWEVSLSPQTGEISGEFKRLTNGAGNETAPSCATTDTIAFVNTGTRRDIWSLPLNVNTAKTSGPLERITQGLAMRENPLLSEDGRSIAFASTQAGQQNIWIHDLATGKESHVAPSSFMQRFPLINPSGSKIAYSSYENGKRLVYVSAPESVPDPPDPAKADPPFLAKGGPHKRRTIRIHRPWTPTRDFGRRSSFCTPEQTHLARSERRLPLLFDQNSTSKFLAAMGTRTPARSKVRGAG